MMKIMINVYALYIIINMMNLYQILNLASVTKSKLSEYYTITGLTKEYCCMYPHT